MMIGYYQIGKNFKTSPEDFISQFCTTGGGYNSDCSFETVHNMLHNNQGYIINDATFSITNPIFFLYHSFLDHILETRIQEFNN